MEVHQSSTSLTNMPIWLDGNPGHQAYALLNKGYYNNFEVYKPENKFDNENGEIGALDPNDKTIQIWSPSLTKAIWSSLKLAFSSS
jgi:hypothetical protein